MKIEIDTNKLPQDFTTRMKGTQAGHLAQCMDRLVYDANLKDTVWSGGEGVALPAAIWDPAQTRERLDTIGLLQKVRDLLYSVAFQEVANGR